MRDYFTDKIQAQLITKDKKRGLLARACRLHINRKKLLGKVLIPVLVGCHFIKTKKRLVIVLWKTQFKNIIHLNSAMNAYQIDLRIFIYICAFLQCLNPVLLYKSYEFNQSPNQKSGLAEDQMCS